ncbi:hypothetical protein ACMVCI_003523 [Yersinia enterocolitica]
MNDSFFNWQASSKPLAVIQVISQPLSGPPTIGSQSAALMKLLI